ncbi:MAG TPA: class I SAM-dependent methyltransferase [Anaerolineaceae bacterium]|nr:class I SAM-dependent methyltransferase [Anaerolineaceae bacterium]
MDSSKTHQRIAASFRDPSGFLFQHQGVLYRQVNQSYQTDYDRLISSGLVQTLIEKRRLIAHQEVEDVPAPLPAIGYKIIRPERVPFISYPYEWSFSQLKDAALLTLKIQKVALKAGMSLKDASAYNVQFHQGAPIFIDTLSFETYVEGRPWVAYRQFCQHFLAPLALMATTDIRLNHLLQNDIDGIPLDLASRLLPWQTRLNFGLATHIHMHASAQKKYSDEAVHDHARKPAFSRAAMTGLIDNLTSTVKKLTWQPAGTEWGAYYSDTNYSDDAFEEKKRIVRQLIGRVQPVRVLDLGANTGVFSRIAAEDSRCLVLSTDIDPAAVELNYLAGKKTQCANILPLRLDLTNPWPAIGWNNQEREAFLQRGKADLVMALALVHHLAISNNVPLADIAGMLSELSRFLIIEFVPKEDSQVQRLLASREDIFPTYTLEHFVAVFSQRFTLREQVQIPGTLRTLFLFEKA